MVKELYQTILRETSQRHQRRNRLHSKKSITKSGCRVYRDGFLGIAGTLGEPTANVWAQAEANLARQIPCPWGPETGKRRTCRRGAAMDAGRFLQLSEQLLKTLGQDFPSSFSATKSTSQKMRFGCKTTQGRTMPGRTPPSR